MLKIADDKYLTPGDKILRKKLVEIFNVSNQGGITPSNKNKLIFLFSDPRIGENFGYLDGWIEDIFFYSGKGQKGDMQLASLNKSLYLTLENNYRIFLFNGARGNVTYENEFRLDSQLPYIEVETLDTHGLLRTSILFRLIPMNNNKIRSLPLSKLQIPYSTTSNIVSLEELESLITTGKNNNLSYKIEFIEKQLINRYANFLKNEKNQYLQRNKISISNDSILFTDGWLEEEKTLIEAKASVTRENIRMAIGQLFDYRRFIKPRPDTLAVLLPKKPRKDLVELLISLNIKIIYEENKIFFTIN